MKILRSFNWNDTDYTVVLQDDGTKIELRCTSKEAPVIMAKLDSILEPEPEPEKLDIKEYSDEALLAEVKLRDIKQVILGEAI